MPARVERLWPVLVVVGVAAIAVLAFPYLASAYYLEAGGRAIEDPEHALQLLNKALAWDRGNAQAYRLLGRVYGNQGDLAASIRALEDYVEMKAENPLGHVELAQAYEAMDSQSSRPADPALSLRIAQEWRRAGLTTEWFVASGDTAQQKQQYDEALLAYRRAMRLEPDLGDLWYYVGRVHARQERWTEALNAYELASASERFSSVHRSSPYYDSGLIYQAQLSPPELEAALAAYEAALLTDDFPSSTEAADSHYRRGWLQRQLGANVEEYIVEFQRAVEIDPNHSLAHAFLGQAYFQRDQDIKAAEAQILLALELSPNSEWIYIILGDVYREAGRVADAAAAYRQALAIVPDFAAARTRLEALEDNSSDR